MPPLFNQFFFLLIGAVILYLGAEWLVKGAVGLALRLGVSPLVAGLTVVALGTSAPEVVVAVQSTLEGRGGIIAGNVIGSNLMNIGLILGLSAIISPMGTDVEVIKRDMPALVFMLGLLALLLADGEFSRFDAAIQLSCMAFYLYIVLVLKRGGASQADAEEIVHDTESAGAPQGSSVVRLILITMGGAALLIGGGKLFLGGAVAIAKEFQLSDVVIGSAIVALGTATPELLTSVIAAVRGHGSLAVGNAIGSVTFNSSVIPGVAGMVAPFGVDMQPVWLNFGVLGFTVVFATIGLVTGQRLERWEGIGLVLCWAGFFAMQWGL
ncbi:MAG: Inner membrane protein YrbG [Myxococcota bacterium]|nr:Inner membrane protein YrbG [Myxococcota bacterium]